MTLTETKEKKSVRQNMAMMTRVIAQLHEWGYQEHLESYAGYGFRVALGREKRDVARIFGAEIPEIYEAILPVLEHYGPLYRGRGLPSAFGPMSFWKATGPTLTEEVIYVK